MSHDAEVITSLMEENHDLRQYEWVVEGILLVIVGALGVLGNFMSIWIFTCRFSKQGITKNVRIKYNT